VAELFRDAGCEANTRVDVPGARGIDNVDVLVRFDSLGIPDVWAVECKDESRAVPRGAVQLFHKKVENIGASRGVMVSRGGYQTGCAAVAEKTNILLTTPSSLAGSLEAAVTRQRLQRLLSRVTRLLDFLAEMRKHGERRPGKPFRYGLMMKLPTGPGSDQYLGRIGKLAFVKEQVTDVLVGKDVILVPSSDEDPYGEETVFEVVSSPREFCDVLDALLTDAEAWSAGLIPAD
jgi:hypothetical protein